jgi:hypothetical protein
MRPSIKLKENHKKAGEKIINQIFEIGKRLPMRIQGKNRYDGLFLIDRKGKKTAYPVVAHLMLTNGWEVYIFADTRAEFGQSYYNEELGIEDIDDVFVFAYVLGHEDEFGKGSLLEWLSNVKYVTIIADNEDLLVLPPPDYSWDI